MDAEALFYRGSRLAAVGRHVEAAAAYRECLRMTPTSFTAAENLGISLADVGLRSEAVAAFEHAVSIRPQRSESYSLLARAIHEAGSNTSRARELFRAAVALTPSRAELHYELARSDQLFDGGASNGAFAESQRLAYQDWRQRMGCERLASWEAGATEWHRGGAVRHVRVLHPAGGETYGPDRRVATTWRRDARLRWPPLDFEERSIVFAELEDVWISGNDGVVTDSRCGLYLPSHGVEIPLHLNLPHETVAARLQDTSIREEGVVLSLVQLFAANFYSFVADALGTKRLLPVSMISHHLPPPSINCPRSPYHPPTVSQRVSSWCSTPSTSPPRVGCASRCQPTARS